MRDAKPARANRRPPAATRPAPGPVPSAATRSAAAGARVDLRSPWWPWPRALGLAGWPATGVRARRPAK
jgi:hypothetical protein